MGGRPLGPSHQRERRKRPPDSVWTIAFGREEVTGHCLVTPRDECVPNPAGILAGDEYADGLVGD